MRTDTGSDIDALALNCRFRDCTHTVESKCAVLAALTGGKLPHDRYRAFLKLHREMAHLEESQSKRAALERKRQTKSAQRAFNRLKRGGGDEL